MTRTPPPVPALVVAVEEEGLRVLVLRVEAELVRERVARALQRAVAPESAAPQQVHRQVRLSHVFSRPLTTKKKVVRIHACASPAAYPALV